MSISMECPSCLHAFTLPDEMAGRKSKCPECNFSVFVPRTDTPVETPSAPQSAPEEPTAIQRAAQTASKKMATPKPVKKQRVTKSSTTPLPTAPVDNPFDFNAKPSTGTVRRRRRGGLGLILLVAVFVFAFLGLLVVGGGAAAWYYWNKASKVTAVETPPSVEVKEAPPPVETKKPEEKTAPKESSPKKPGGKVAADPAAEPAGKTKPEPAAGKNARLTLQPSPAQSVKPGQEATFAVNILREDCKGDVKIELKPSHPGLEANRWVILKADFDRIPVPVTVAEKTPPGMYTIHVTATLGALSDKKDFSLQVLTADGKPVASATSPLPPAPMSPAPMPPPNGALKTIESRAKLTGFVYEGHRGAVESVALAPVDQKWAISGGADGTVRIWDTGKKMQKGIITIHNASVSAVAVSADGKWIASGDVKGNVYLHTSEGKDSRSLTPLPKATNRINALTFSPKGDLLVAAGGTEMTAWDVTTDKRLASVPGQFTDVHFAADGGRVYAPFGLRIVEWNPRAAAAPTAVGNGQDYSPLTFDVSPSKQALAVVSRKGIGAVLQRVDLKTGQAQLFQEFKELNQIPLRVVVSDLAGYALTSDRAGLLKAWHLEVGKELFSIPGHKGEVHALAISADGKHIVSGGADGTFRAFELENE